MTLSIPSRLLSIGVGAFLLIGLIAVGLAIRPGVRPMTPEQPATPAVTLPPAAVALTFPTRTPVPTPAPPTLTPQPSATPTVTLPPTTAGEAAASILPTLPPLISTETPAPASYPPLEVDWTVVDGGLDRANPDTKTLHQVQVNATGGDGTYSYYLIQDENAPLETQRQPGPVITVPWVRCGAVIANLWVYSGDGQQVFTKLYFSAFCPTPEGCTDCEAWWPGKGVTE